MKLLVYLSLIAAGSIGFNQSATADSRGGGYVPYIPAEAAYNSNGRDMTVRMVQLALERHGYYVALNTGEFGFDTRRAIRRYRADHGLRVIGKIDDELLRSLGIQPAAAGRRSARGAR